MDIYFKLLLIFQVTTYVMNISEYINRMCDKKVKTYSEIDCNKVNSDEQRLLRQLMR